MANTDNTHTDNTHTEGLVVNKEHLLDESIGPEKKDPYVPRVDYTVFNESMSSSIGDLAGALSKAQGMMSNGAKDKQGYGYKYMELGSLIDIIRPALSTCELSVIQTHQVVLNVAKPTVVTHTTLIHSSGQWHKSSIELPIKIMANLSQAQMIGVNCTYGRRYALQAIFLVASEEDTDASGK